MDLIQQYNFHVHKYGEPACLLEHKGPLSDLPDVVEKARSIGIELKADINIWYKPVESLITVSYCENPKQK